MYDELKAYASKLTQNLSERGLYCEIKVVNEESKAPSSDSGVYIVFGCDETTVQNTAFNEHYMIEEYDRQCIENYMIFPKCTVYKLKDLKLPTASEFCNERDAVHLLTELFTRYNLDVPNEITQNDFLAITRCYFESIDEDATQRERDYAKQYLEYLLKITDSGLTQEEYDKKHGKFSILKDKKTIKQIAKAASDISKRTVTYVPTAENCVSDSDLKQSGNSCISVNIDHDILPFFEEEMKKYPKIRYSLEKVGKPYVYGDLGYKYWHMLTFPAQSEKIVAGIMHKYERNLTDIAKKYTPGRNNILGTEVLATDFDQIYEYALEHDIDFYFDEKSVYTRTTINKIGIVTEDEYNRDALVNALTGFIASKIEGSYLDRDPVYQQKLETQKDFDSLRRSVEDEQRKLKEQRANNRHDDER